MIWETLKHKLLTRGPVGFAYDAAELAVACAVVGVYEIALSAAAIGGVVVALPIAAAMWVSELAEYRER